MLNDPSALFAALSNFGGLGIVIGFLVWHTAKTDASRLRLDQDRLADKRVQLERQMNLDRERLETDKAMAAGLAALTAVIQSWNRHE